MRLKACWLSSKSANPSSAMGELHSHVTGRSFMSKR
jgi:hypothetical protein